MIKDPPTAEREFLRVLRLGHRDEEGGRFPGYVRGQAMASTIVNE